MIKTNFLLAMRNLLHAKGYTLLNLFGLASGLTCFAFIMHWVDNELSYDLFHKNVERIFRVAGKVSGPNESFEHACSAVPMAAALQKDFPQIEQVVRMDRNDAIVRVGSKSFAEDGILATDPSFFKVFSYSLLQGDIRTALNEPYSIILTTSMAKKYFGQADPMGRFMTLLLYDPNGKGENYRVTGVLPDAPSNAHFTFRFLVSFKSLETFNPLLLQDWGNNSFYTYVMLRNDQDRDRVEAGLPGFYTRNYLKGLPESTTKYGLFLQALPAIHLSSHLRYEMEPTGNKSHIYLFLTIGFFILLLAGINYMNLATARSLGRAKEVGVQKVLGASRSRLILRQLTESVLVVLFSLCLALFFIQALDPLYSGLSGKEWTGLDLRLFSILLLITLLTGILSGLYPAFFITAPGPATVLKGSYKSGVTGIFVRKVLVVFQFAVAIILIAAIGVVHSQLNFISRKDLGFSNKELLSIKVNGSTEVIQGFESFKQGLLRHSQFKGVATSNTMIIGGIGDAGAKIQDGSGVPVSVHIHRLRVDPDYIPVYGMQLLAGRNFYHGQRKDTLAYIINEAAVSRFGWKDPESSIHRPFEMSGRKGQVVGVVKNFHFHHLQHAIEPLVMVLGDNAFSQITVKADMTDRPRMLALLSREWNNHFQGQFMEFSFVDQKLQAQYQAEQKFAKFFLYFSVLAVWIACLGLLGLTAFSAKMRTKEMGIRKVLGASITKLTLLLSGDLLKLVLLAALLAIPLSWILMEQWLIGFAYRIRLQAWVFIVSSLLVLGLAFITVALHSIKAAKTNPVKSLRME